MSVYTNIELAIQNYFLNLKGVEYIEDIEIDKVGDTYHIVLIQGNQMRPLHLFIESESEEDCIEKLIQELRDRDLSSVRYSKLFKIK